MTDAKNPKETDLEKVLTESLLSIRNLENSIISMDAKIELLDEKIDNATEGIVLTARTLRAMRDVFDEIHKMALQRFPKKSS